MPNNAVMLCKTIKVIFMGLKRCETPVLSGRLHHGIDNLHATIHAEFAGELKVKVIPFIGYV